MRASKFGRLVVRGIVVGLLAAGAWLAATMVAHADNDWQISPADEVVINPQPAVTESANIGAE